MAARRKEVEAAVSNIVKGFLRIKGFKNTSAFAFKFKETLHFFRSSEVLPTQARQELSITKNLLPAVYSVLSFCDLLSSQFSTAVGFNKHIHHNIANHLVWLATFSDLLIKDYDESNMAESERIFATDVATKLVASVEVFLSWRQQSRKYSELLVVRGATSHLQYKPTPVQRLQRMVSIVVLDDPEPGSDAMYLVSLESARRSLLYIEVNRTIKRLRRKLIFHHDKTTTKAALAAAAEKNAETLRSIDALSLSNLIDYIGNTAAPDESTLSALAIINALFKEYDARLSASVESKKPVAVTSLRSIQDILCSLGVMEMIAALLNRLIINEDSEKQRVDELPLADRGLLSKVLSLSLQLASNMMYEGNHAAQNRLLNLAGYDTETKMYSKTKPNLVAAVATFLSGCLSNSLEIYISSEQLEHISCVFRFCGMWAQQNENAQNLLRDQKRPDTVNIVTDVASTQDFLLRYFALKMVSRDGFIQNEEPEVVFNWTRDFVKPTAPRLNFAVGAVTLLHLLDTISGGFAALKDICQGPCTPNQLSALPALREIPALLDVIGTFLSDEPHRSIFTRTRAKLNTGYEALTNDENMMRVVKRSELNAVRFLLSQVEGASQDRILFLGEQLNEGVMFDNLDRLYKRMFDRRERKQRIAAKTAVVSYLALLFTIADAQEMTEDGITTRSDNIKAWQEKCAEEGHNTAGFLASVEIIDKNKSIDRVYFPVPEFVKHYWSYPGTSIISFLSYLLFQLQCLITCRGAISERSGHV
jgi:hypothetical protein